MKSTYAKCATDSWPAKPYDWYRWRYVLTWSVGWLLFVGAVVLLVVGILSATPHSSSVHGITDPSTNSTLDQHPLRAAVAFPGMAVCVALFFLMYGPAAQLRYRTGMGLFGGLGGTGVDAAPSSLSAVRAAATSFRIRGLSPTAVGGAWSNVLRVETTKGPRMHMRRMVGKVPNLPLTWYAGTTCMDVNNELRQLSLPLQLVNVPSYGGVTLGAWVATQGHGMTGRFFSHGPVTVKARVLHMLSGIETDDGPEMLLDKFGNGPEKARQYLVLTVSIGESASLVPDVKMLRQGRWLKTVDDAEWALRKEAQVACLFIGGSKTLALTWQPHAGEDVRGGGLLMDVGITLFAVVGYGLSDPSGPGRDRTELLSKVPAFFHFYLSPLYIWALMLVGVMNAEFYTSDLDLTPERMLKLSNEIQAVYKRYNGRCEFRFTGKLTYFDLFAFSDGAVISVLQVLAANGVKLVAQHPGKYQIRQEIFACVGIELDSAHGLSR